jgi:hypothetical protein
MAQRLQVSCVNKSDKLIINIGGKKPDGTQWKMNQSEAIAETLDGSNRFFVLLGGYTVDVEVADHNGNLYLKTKPDSTGKDILLSLPECP